MGRNRTLCAEGGTKPSVNGNENSEKRSVTQLFITDKITAQAFLDALEARSTNKAAKTENEQKCIIARARIRAGVGTATTFNPNH